MLSIVPAAWAAGGSGGRGGAAGDEAVPGGAGGTSSNLDGAPGGDSSIPNIQGGGGGGGGGASRTSISGGAGGAGGQSSVNLPNGFLPFPGALVARMGAGGNGGRAGDAGALQSGTITGSIVGGAGSAGQQSSDFGTEASGGGGGGGEGGVGLIVLPGTAANVLGGLQIVGGAGGSGGPGMPTPAEFETLGPARGSGGSGGDGGVGVYLGAGTSFVNAGLVAGGQGGAPGPGGVPLLLISEKLDPLPGGQGAGGAGIEADGASIFNSGTIRGGLNAASTLRGDAVYFRSGTNLLELRAGSVVDGVIHVDAAASARVRAAANGLRIDGGMLVDGAAIVDTNGFDFEASSAITGAGSLEKTGQGTFLLSAPGSYTGGTTVSGGTLRAGAAQVFSQSSVYQVSAGGTLDTGGFNQTLAGLTNAGTVSLLSAVPGSTLTVTGPYVGNGGTLRLGTFLGGSGSASDRLVLDGAGASASGSTNLQINNLGGLGALTTGNGIEVVSALNGATTTAQTSRSAFALAGGHVDAGAFEYRLHAADANGQGENWYLRSTIASLPPATQALLDLLIGVGASGLGGAAFNPGAVGAGTGAGGNGVPAYRLEAGLFAALPEQIRQANFGMIGNLNQRVGDIEANSAASASEPGRRAWGRVIAMRRDIAQRGTVDARSEGKYTGFQAGTDLFSSNGWRAGVYVGQLDGDMKVRGFAGGVQGRLLGDNDLRNQYLGGYATWSLAEYYADAVLQFGRHRYSAAPAGGNRASGKASSALASVETGRSFSLGDHWKVEPQLQLAYQRLNVDDVNIVGSQVLQDTDNGWLVRAGVRVAGELSTAAGVFKPYGRVNVYRRSGGRDATVFSTAAARTPIVSSTGSTTTELAAGFTQTLGKGTTLYGEVGRLWASGGRARIESSWQASLGVRVTW